MVSYVIIGVRYDRTHTGIDSVKRCPYLNGRMGEVTVETRTKIVYDIRNDLLHVTARVMNGKWRWGAAVKVVNKRGGLIIQTEGNETETDNLDELPEF